jgi:hypothetical protein
MSVDFLAAYAGSSVAQAALVAGATATSAPLWLGPLRHRAFALIPLFSLVGVVLALNVWPSAADTLAKVALVLVPLLALIGAARSGWPALGVVLAGLAAALLDVHGLAGQLGALVVIAASCMLLGSLLVELTPPRWLGAGIVAMAIADLVLVASGLLEPAANALNQAGVTHSLPQLQRVQIGPLAMGYGDVFLPALVGALLAARARPRAWAAGLTLGFGLVAAIFFLLVDQLPATVPVAFALFVVEGGGALRKALERRRAARREAHGISSPPCGDQVRARPASCPAAAKAPSTVVAVSTTARGHEAAGRHRVAPPRRQLRG